MRLARWVRISVALVPLTFGALSAKAAAPPQIPSCASCHGANGMGNPGAGFPALAGLPAQYLSRQLDAFKHGGRKNSIMMEMAAPLDAQQRHAIAVYYAGLPVPKTAEPASSLNADGRNLARDGDWAGKLTGLPACDACHGPYGVGVGTQFPRLAGQPQTYLAAQLMDWQKGSRTNDPLHLMRNVAGKLTLKQITAVSAYYASLSPDPAALPGAAPKEAK